MLKKIEALEYEKHQNLRLDKINSYDFAKQVPRVKLSFSEMRQAAAWFPIVFLEETPGIPQALLSLDGQTNAYVDDNGQWTVPYIPFFFRMYPFVLGAIDDKEGQFALCLDPDAPHFNSSMGDPLFTAEGKPTEFLENTVLKSLETYQKELNETQTLFGEVNNLGLIVDRTVTVRADGKNRNIEGFKGVDMEKLKDLDDHILASLVRDGSMAPIYEHLNSLTNFTRLLAGKD